MRELGNMKASARGAIVVIAICSWFAVSNHCAFAALATRADFTQCPFHSKPKEKQSTGAQCCKILRAVTSVASKNWVRNDTRFLNADDHWIERALVLADSQTALVPLFLDTGPPPEAYSFAELILQRSLFAHAPPSLA